MRKEIATYNYLVDYLNEVRSKGRYSVTLTELKEKFNITEKAINQNLYRLKNKKTIAQVRQGFYVILPPEHAQRGILPIYLFIDDLMKFLKRDYYLGLYSAASLHGAGHQQPMSSQIIIEKPPLRNIKNSKINIEFFTKGKRFSQYVQEKKTDAGYIKISSPELTALDLVYYHKRIGGINRLLLILEELVEEIVISRLVSVAKKYNHKTTIQRLGFLYDEVLGLETISEALYKIIKTQSLKPIPLSILQKKKTGVVNEKWKVILNIDIDY